MLVQLMGDEKSQIRTSRLRETPATIRWRACWRRWAGMRERLLCDLVACERERSPLS